MASQANNPKYQSQHPKSAVLWSMAKMNVTIFDKRKIRRIFIGAGIHLIYSLSFPFLMMRWSIIT
jgi:hypothetical protein